MSDREYDIGAFVRERRRAHDLTQRQLAGLAGVGTRFLSELERGKSTVRLAEVSAVLAVFGKTVGVAVTARISGTGADRVTGTHNW
ncbi:MAG: helix-turn-helix domain-containing protein [Myxococcota bacterium]